MSWTHIGSRSIKVAATMLGVVLCMIGGYIYLTEDDIKGLPCFQNETLSAIKVPPGTTLEVPDPTRQVKRKKVNELGWLILPRQKINLLYMMAESEEEEHPEYIIRGTPGGIQHCGDLDNHCYWGNEVKLYQRHVDALFTMFLRKKPDINHYVCTINKTFAKPGQRMYFQVHYTEQNLLDYIDPHNDTLMVKLANGHLLTKCRIMLGTDKRATITTNWSEFRRRANIREGHICAFRFRVTSKRRLVLIVHRL